jgi:hypothetical protein
MEKLFRKQPLDSDDIHSMFDALRGQRLAAPKPRRADLAVVAAVLPPDSDLRPTALHFLATALRAR